MHVLHRAPDRASDGASTRALAMAECVLSEPSTEVSSGHRLVVWRRGWRRGAIGVQRPGVVTASLPVAARGCAHWPAGARLPLHCSCLPLRRSCLPTSSVNARPAGRDCPADPGQLRRTSRDHVDDARQSISPPPSCPPMATAPS